MTATAQVLEPPNSHCSCRTSHGLPTYVWNSWRVTYIHLWISLGTLISLPLLPLFSLQGPCRPLLWPLPSVLFVAAVPCLPKPHSCLWPGPFPKDLCLAKVQLMRLTTTRAISQRRTMTASVSYKLGRKTFIPSMSPSDRRGWGTGRSHSMIPWLLDCSEVYYNTCQFTHPAPILQGKDKGHLGNVDGRISQPDTMLHVPETSTVSGGRNNRTLTTGPSSWIWLAGPYLSFYSK